LQNVLFKRIIKRKMRYTLKDFKAEYSDDQACLLAVLESRYGDTCPRCGVIGVKWHPVKGRKTFVCSECDRHVSPLADTIFRKSETSLWNWFYAIFQFSVAKNGVSAKELERTLGVTYKTAWRMAKQIRLLMEQDGDMLGGKGEPVEVDETYAPSRRHPRAIGRSKKQIIFGAVERDGRASSCMYAAQVLVCYYPKLRSALLRVATSTVTNGEHTSHSTMGLLAHHGQPLPAGVCARYCVHEHCRRFLVSAEALN
jgi:transposase-like protein